MSRLVALVERTARPEAAAVARAVVGLAAALKALERAPVLERLADPATVRVPYVTGQPSIADLPVIPVIAVWMCLGIAFAVGWRTRVVGIALTGLLLAVLFSDQQLYSNHLYLLTWLVGLLTLARSGAALSLDTRNGAPARSIPAWPLWLLRLHVSVVYLFAGMSKVTAEYLSGSVVALSLRADGFLAVPMEWRTFEVMAAASVLAIVAEIGLAIALWLPRWRRTAFVVGLGLHASIALWFDPTLPLILFAIIALAPYVLFLDLERRPQTLVFDDSCGFCTAWVAWFRRLDWLRFFRFVPGSDTAQLERLGVPQQDADRALQLVTADEREQGFDAVIGALERLPVSFLWAPILRLWPIRPLGRAAYARVAARRQCAVSFAPDGKTP